MSNDKNNGRGAATKYDAAVDAARGRETGLAKQEEAGAAVLAPRGTHEMVLRPSEDDIKQLMNDENLEFAPQVHSIEEGEMVIGLLEGKGPSTTFTQEDPFTKQIVTRVVDTWIIAAPNGGLRISILSSIQLDKKLPPFVGSPIKIFRRKNVKTSKNFKVADYLVAGPKLTDGTSRSWVQSRVIDVASNALDAPVGPAQLGSGSPADLPGGEDAQA